MNENLYGKDDQLFHVLTLRVLRVVALRHELWHAHAQTNDEDDDEYDKRDEQIALDLGPDADYSPDDYGEEDDAQRNVEQDGPVKALVEQADRIAHHVVEQERCQKRTVIGG